MQKVKILVVEDHFILQNYIDSELRKLGFEVIGKLFRGEDVMPFLKQQQPDLILMDINLDPDGITGVDAAKQLKLIYDIPIIFLTELRDQKVFNYTIHSVKPEAYMTKPFNASDLGRNITLALVKHADRKGEKPKEINVEESPKAISKHNYLLVKEGKGRMKKIPFDEIIWLEALRPYSKIKTVKGEVICNDNLKTLGEKLDAERFFKVHQSFIIDLDKFEDVIYPEKVIMQDGKEIPIGRSYRKEFNNILKAV